MNGSNELSPVWAAIDGLKTVVGQTKETLVEISTLLKTVIVNQADQGKEITRLETEGAQHGKPNWVALTGAGSIILSLIITVGGLVIGPMKMNINELQKDNTQLEEKLIELDKQMAIYKALHP